MSGRVFPLEDASLLATASAAAEASGCAFLHPNKELEKRRIPSSELRSKVEAVSLRTEAASLQSSSLERKPGCGL